MQDLTAEILTVIQQRPAVSHKGNYGRVVTIGGNKQYGGAILMSTSAAVHAGAGLVTCVTAPENLTALHAMVPEAMFVSSHDYSTLVDVIQSATVIVIGPGLGTEDFAADILQIVLNRVTDDQYLIIDGSAITILADVKEELRRVIPRGHLIFTPHEMEWQRLSGIKIAEQTEENNRKKQEEFQATVVLKKHHTEIYAPDTPTMRLTIGGPHMATGGMGDTLTGIIAAFMSQFAQVDPQAALDAAVYTHSAIADELSQDSYVVLPTDIIGQLQRFMKEHCK